MSEQQKDPANDSMYALFAIFIVIFGIYFFFKTQIFFTYLTIKLWELKIINSIIYSADRDYAIHLIQTKPLGSWTFTNVLLVGKETGRIFNIIYMIIIGYFSYKVWSKNPTDKFKRILNMNTLKQSEQKIWPYIAPVVNIDLMKESFDSGPYAMAMRPYDYAVKHKLLQDERNIASMDKIKTEKLFISQLDKLWSGFNKLKKHEQVIFAILAGYGCGDRKAAQNAVNAIALSMASNPKKPDYSSAQPLLKYVEDPRVLAIVSKHAYVYTVMAQMVEFSRTTGVVPPSFFIWLKPKDRILWYVIDCIGRQTPYIEVAGIFGHWRAEQIANHKLEAAYVAKAVIALEKGLSEVKLKPQ